MFNVGDRVEISKTNHRPQTDGIIKSVHKDHKGIRWYWVESGSCYPETMLTSTKDVYNPYNLLPAEIELKRGESVYNEYTDPSSIKYAGESYWTKWHDYCTKLAKQGFEE